MTGGEKAYVYSPLTCLRDDASIIFSDDPLEETTWSQLKPDETKQEIYETG